MNSNGPSKDQIDNLVAQDTGISEAQFGEFRMKLEASLESLKRQARRTRATMIGSVVVLAVCYATAWVVNLTPTVPWPHKILAPMWSALTIIALFTAAVSAARYWSIRRPALDQAKTDLQIAMFDEVLRQFAELKERLDKLSA